MADENRREPRSLAPALLAIAALGVFLWLGARTMKLTDRLPGRGATTVDQAVIVERTRAVARLVTSETTLRDVVVYQNRLLGSTKRSLVVVTGRVLSGFDLDRGTEVRVDHEAKVVHVVLPPAAVLGVEITDLRTYEEQRGLWNPFRPADRDSIFRLAREQLVRSAGEVELAKHTQESARRLLETLVKADGYRTEVTFADDSYAGAEAGRREARE
jgi:Protein of unknown function (DUF4230)